MRRVLILLISFFLLNAVDSSYDEIDAAKKKTVKTVNRKKTTAKKRGKSAPYRKKGYKGKKPLGRKQPLKRKPIPIVVHNIGNGQPTVLRPMVKRVQYRKGRRKYWRNVTVQRTPLNTTFDGIDISRHQGLISWPKMEKSVKLKYVYIKATEGSDLKDIHYHTNIGRAKAAGYHVGSYHFFRPNIPAKIQLQNFTSQVHIDKQDLLPMLDVEDAGHFNKQEFVARVKEMLELMTEYYGQKPLLYTMKNFYDNYLVNEFMEYPLMIGAYSRYPDLVDGRKFTIWQFSCHGVVNGIDGDVDLSVFNEGSNINDIWLDKCLVRNYMAQQSNRHYGFKVVPEMELMPQSPLQEPTPREIRQHNKAKAQKVQSKKTKRR